MTGLPWKLLRESCWPSTVVTIKLGACSPTSWPTFAKGWTGVGSAVGAGVGGATGVAGASVGVGVGDGTGVAGASVGAGVGGGTGVAGASVGAGVVTNVPWVVGDGIGG